MLCLDCHSCKKNMSEKSTHFINPQRKFMDKNKLHFLKKKKRKTC